MHSRQSESYYEWNRGNSAENFNFYIGRNINDFLIKNKKIIYNVNGDGHCILNAILCCLNYEGEMITLDDMKRKLIRFAYENKEKYSQFMINTKPIKFYHSFLEYINEKNWQDDIGDLILTIVNEAYNIETNIFNVEYETIMSVNVIKNGRINKKPHHKINLCKRASHYDAIVTIGSNWNSLPSDSTVYTYVQYPYNNNKVERGNYNYNYQHRHNSLIMSPKDKLIGNCSNCKRKIQHITNSFTLDVPISSNYYSPYLNNHYNLFYYNNNGKNDRGLW